MPALSIAASCAVGDLLDHEQVDVLVAPPPRPARCRRPGRGTRSRSSPAASPRPPAGGGFAPLTIGENHQTCTARPSAASATARATVDRRAASGARSPRSSTSAAEVEEHPERRERLEPDPPPTRRLDQSGERQQQPGEQHDEHRAPEDDGPHAHPANLSRRWAGLGSRACPPPPPSASRPSIGGLAGASLAAHRGVGPAAARGARRRGRPGRVGGGGPGPTAGGRDPGAVAADRGQHRAGGAARVGLGEGGRRGPARGRHWPPARWSGRWGCGRRRWRWARPWVLAVGQALRPAATPRRPSVASSTVLAYRTLSALLFRDAQVSLLADRGQRRRPAVRGAPARAVEVRRHRLRPRARRGAGARYTPDAAGRRDRGLPRRAGRARTGSGAGRPARPRVLRAHHAVRARHRPAVAAVGASRLPALPHRSRASPRAGEHPHEPARGPARDPQSHRHDHRRRRHGLGPRLDPVLRRRRRADHGRHLHHLHPRRPWLRQRRVPSARRAASPPPCSPGHGPTEA